MTERGECLIEWMTKLPMAIRKQIPIINLAIPGAFLFIDFIFNFRENKNSIKTNKFFGSIKFY